MTNDNDDPSMDVAFEFAKNVLGKPLIPAWLEDVEACRRAADDLDKNAMPKKGHVDHRDRIAVMHAINAYSSEWAMNPDSCPGIGGPGTDGMIARQNVLLRLWAGCTDTAKAIKYATRSGVTTREQREAWFVRTINPRCDECPIYRAGSLCALAYTAHRKQLNELCLWGIPADARVLKQLIDVVKTAFGTP